MQLLMLTNTTLLLSVTCKYSAFVFKTAFSFHDGKFQKEFSSNFLLKS